MAAFANLKLERKILIGFGLLSLLCVVLSIVSLSSLSRVNSSTVDIESNWLQSVRVLGEIRSEISVMHRAVLNHTLCDSADCEQRYAQLFRQSAAEYAASRQTYTALIGSEEEKRTARELDEDVASYSVLAQQALSLSGSGQKEQAKALLQTQMKVAYEKLRDVLSRDVALNDAGAKHAAEGAERTYRSARFMIFSAVFLCLGVSLIVGRLIARRIANPIIKASKLLEKVANKDLTETLEVQSKDEIGQMASSLNTMVFSLREMLQQIMQDSEQLNQATMQISSAAGQTSDAARLQADHVQQVAAASQEMAAVISDIAHNTERAALASRESATSAQHGGSVVREAISSMEHISLSNAEIVKKMESLGHSSEQIGKVVSVIQEIADQTNLLALNAAIESARAGEHGRGFAVVAGEVRRLAERTRRSTEEISEMVATIQNGTREALDVTAKGREIVLQGLERAKTADDSLKSIITTASSSEQMVALIATAATQQTSASSEVSHNMEKIAQMIEESSTAADQTATSCKSLAELASNLDATVNQFRLEEGAARRQPALAYIN